MTNHPKPLGRNIPPDREHVKKYALADVKPEAKPTHVPVALGCNWFENFDEPEKGSDGRWRIGKGDLGNIRGGHCFCLEPARQKDQPGGERDLAEWWDFYDQQQEGACVGFGLSRALTLIYRTAFDAFWLYDDARRIEDTYPDGEGTYVRSGGAALVKWGAHPESSVVPDVPTVIERQAWREGVRGQDILEYRWATTAQQVADTLGYGSDATEVALLNSWGREGYPHRVYLPLELIDQLLGEEGEAAIIVTK